MIEHVRADAHRRPHQLQPHEHDFGQWHILEVFAADPKDALPTVVIGKDVGIVGVALSTVQP